MAEGGEGAISRCVVCTLHIVQTHSRGRRNSYNYLQLVRVQITGYGRRRSSLLINAIAKHRLGRPKTRSPRTNERARERRTATAIVETVLDDSSPPPPSTGHDNYVRKIVRTIYVYLYNIILLYTDGFEIITKNTHSHYGAGRLYDAQARKRHTQTLYYYYMGTLVYRIMGVYRCIIRI